MRKRGEARPKPQIPHKRDKKFTRHFHIVLKRLIAVTHLTKPITRNTKFFQPNIEIYT